MWQIDYQLKSNLIIIYTSLLYNEQAPVQSFLSDSIGSQLVVNWYSIGSQLSFHWHSIEIPLVLHLYSIDTPLVVNLVSIGSQLVTYNSKQSNNILTRCCSGPVIWNKAVSNSTRGCSNIQGQNNHVSKLGVNWHFIGSQVVLNW